MTTETKSVVDIIGDIRATSSRNEKEEILKAHADNELLRKTLFMAIDPFVHFYTSELPEDAPILSWTGTPSEEYVINGLYAAAVTDGSREKIRDAIRAITSVLNTTGDEDLLDLASMIVSKDLACGVAVGTANKVWPGMCRKFEVMKGEERAHLSKMKGPYWVSLKIDGSRCVVTLSKDGTIKIQSSSGRIYPNMTHLHDEIRFLAAASGVEEIVLDGELLMVTEDGRMEKRELSNGKALKALGGNLPPEEEERFRLFMFDAILSEEVFSSGKDSRPIEERQAPIAAHEIASHYLIPVVGERVETLDEVWALYEKAVDEGREGIMVKSAGSIYEAKRSKFWVKIKKFFDVDLEVIGWEEHSKKADQVGALKVASSDGEIKGSVGSGLVDKGEESKNRYALFKLAQEGKLNGRIYTVRIHDLTEKDDDLSFYLPRIIEHRIDTDADSSQKIRDQVRWDVR